MKLVTAVIVLVILAGCTRNVALPAKGGIHPTVKSEKQLTDEDKYAILDAEAKKRHLRYRIECQVRWTDEPEKVLAYAEHIRAPMGVQYYEDGRMDEWILTDLPSQADAAYALYKAIQSDPTHIATVNFRKPKEERRLAPQCFRRKVGNWKYEPKVEAAQ